MKTIFLLTACILGMYVFADAQDTIPATDPSIEYTGRIDFSSPDAPRFSYSGVSIRARFTGTTIGVIMDDNVGQNHYTVLIDGEVVSELVVTTGKKAYQLANNLVQANHEVELFKRTEEMFGKTQFFGFVVDEGAMLTPIYNVREKLIEYIGNSITCGYGNEGVNGGTFSAITENHYMTYAAVNSRNFNARHLAVCKSGIGIYRNYNGPAGGNSDCMTNLYTRIFLYDEDPKYDFAETPDLVCINLGTNDFSTVGGDSTLYVSNYFRLIDTLQSKYTNPDILCLLGSMMGDPTLSEVRNYLNFIVDSANKKGKGNVYFFEMSQQTGSLGIGIDYHPTVAQHVKNGMELTGYIKAIKGWKLTPLIMNAEVTETTHIQLEFNTTLVDSFNNYAGFAANKNDEFLPVKTVYRDTTHHEILHIILEEAIGIGDKIDIAYTPGTVYSEDSVQLGTILYHEVENNLSETQISRGVINSEGLLVTLTCNKSIKKNATIEGLMISNKDQDILAIDSFSILNKQLLLYMGDAAVKGDSIFASYNGSGFLGEDGITLSPFDKLVLQNNSLYTNLSVNEEKSLVIYPNPNALGWIAFRIDESLIAQGPASYELIGLNGEILKQGLISLTEGNIEIGDTWSEGIYLLKISGGGLSLSESVHLK